MNLMKKIAVKRTKVTLLEFMQDYLYLARSASGKLLIKRCPARDAIRPLLTITETLERSALNTLRRFRKLRI